MITNFRQGLISFQQSGPQPVYLVQSATPSFIDLSVSPTPFIGAIAHGSSDYLIVFDTTVTAAWGPIEAGVDTYLFLDLNLLTGQVQPGSTKLQPIISSVEPTGVLAGQMWFDLSAKVYKTRDPNNTKWLTTPRLVLGYTSGSVNQIVHGIAGSEVGLTEEGNPGFVVFDSQLRPIRTSLGELLTADSKVHLKTTVGTAGVLSTPVNTFVPVKADEPIPVMRLVYFSGTDSVSLASSNPALTIKKNPVGLLTHALAEGEVGSLLQSGEVTWDQWNWPTADHGQPVYCGFDGEITTAQPLGSKIFRVGYIKNAKSILLGIDTETYTQVGTGQSVIISGVPPISVTTGLNVNNELVTSISISPADGTHDGYMSIAQAQMLLNHESRISTAETNIIDLQLNKADRIHQHVAADVTDFADAVNDLLVAGSNIDIQYDNSLHKITISSTGGSGSGSVLVKESDNNGISYNIVHTASDGLAFKNVKVTEPLPGIIEMVQQSIEVYEGANLRATYPNPDNFNFPTKLIFGAGLTATTSGLYNQIVTITAPSVHFLDDLDDVDLHTTPPAAGNALVFDGTNWVPGAGGGGGSAQYLDDLLDVTIIAANPGDVLMFNPSSAQWENSSIGRIMVVNI